MADHKAQRKTLGTRIRREYARARKNLLALLHPPRHPPASPRIPLGRDDVEVHSLVCASDVPMSLWSLKSFIAYSGLLPRVVIHDDGSLERRHRRLFAEQFDGITVLDDRTTGPRMEQDLEPWPACRRMRRRPDFYCARKLLDILFVAQSETVIYIDSDILFFRRPDALLAHAHAGSAAFSADYQTAYSAPRAELEAWSGRSLEKKVNAGLLHIPIAPYREQLDSIERFLAHAEAHLDAVPVNRHEQTAHALVMSALGAARLPAAYAISGEIADETVSFHFVNDGEQRLRFWSKAVPRIRAEIAASLRELLAR